MVVRAEVEGRPASFTLAVGPARTLAWAEDAKAARARGDLSGARALAAAHAASGDDAERAAANDLLGRITLAEGHAEEAFPLLRAALASHRAAGRISDAIDDSFALAFALHQRSHRYDEARAALDSVAKDLPRYPEGRARDPYYRGILASETGDRRAARALLRDAEGRAHVLGLARLERNARAALAVEMQALGNARASLDVLRGLENDPDVKGCERVEVDNNLGWGALLANEASGAVSEDAHGPLERALAVVGCSDAYLASFARANLARLALDEGDPLRASHYLEAARAGVHEPRGTERMSWLDLEARILLARHDAARALARFDEERTLARAGVLLEPEWSALVGRAEACEALGRRADAVTALLQAEDVVDRAMLLVPLGEGRGQFVANRSRSARAAVELLVALGRGAEAARVARRSRTRVLRSVERALRIELLRPAERTRWEAAVRSYRSAREALDAESAGDWKLPRDALDRVSTARAEREHALRTALEGVIALFASVASSAEDADPPGPGDVEVLVHAGRTGWIALVTDASATTAHRVPAPGSPVGELAHALFDPMEARILAARRLRVRTYGVWREVDVHALPFRGAPLLEQLAVDYPLGLRAQAHDAPLERRALIVGDALGDLPAARTEAGLVFAALAPRMPSRLLAGPEATSRAVAGQLSRAGLFHYAGHGVFAGAEGWESALPLADGGRLTIADLFALSPGPRKAILSGCDAARTLGEAEGLGLAQALVATGSEEVLAPVRPVADALAARLARGLYAGGTVDAVADLEANGSLASAARGALRSLRQEDPSADWAAFRVIAR